MGNKLDGYTQAYEILWQDLCELQYHVEGPARRDFDTDEEYQAALENWEEPTKEEVEAGRTMAYVIKYILNVLAKEHDKLLKDWPYGHRIGKPYNTSTKWYEVLTSLVG